MFILQWEGQFLLTTFVLLDLKALSCSGFKCMTWFYQAESIPHRSAYTDLSPMVPSMETITYRLKRDINF